MANVRPYRTIGHNVRSYRTIGPHLRLNNRRVSSSKGLRLVNDATVVRSLFAIMIRQAVEDILASSRKVRPLLTDDDVRTAVWFLGHCRGMAAYLNLNYNKTVAALLRERNLMEEALKPWPESGIA